MPANPNFDTILSTTLYNYRDTLEDNIFKANPFAYWLQQEGRFEKEDGGAKIVVPLLAQKNSTAGSYADYDTIPSGGGTGNATTTAVDAAEYPWQQYAALIAISGIEEAKNNGVEQVIKLLEAKVKQAEMSITEGMDIMFLGNGTGNTNKEWWGLRALVETTNPTRGNFGNIDRTVTTQWQAGYKDTTAEVLGLSRMTTAYNTVSKGNDHPDLVLTTQGLYEKYEGLLQPQLRFSDSRAADGGFQNLLFKGATMFFDSNIGSETGTVAGTMWFLNSKYISLVGHRDVWFKNTPFVRQFQVDARYAQILAYGQLVASNCQRQGVITAKTA